MAYIFGTVSHGTMQPRDLIPAFADALREIDEAGDYAKLLAEAGDLENFDSEEAEFVLEELFDALNGLAPPYFYFGAHPGDGSDYGFWLSEEWHQRMGDDDVFFANDLAEIPADYRGETAIVNDHGNVTYGYVAPDGFHEVWSVV